MTDFKRQLYSKCVELHSVLYNGGLNGGLFFVAPKSRSCRCLSTMNLAQKRTVNFA